MKKKASILLISTIFFYIIIIVFAPKQKNSSLPEKNPGTKPLLAAFIILGDTGTGLRKQHKVSNTIEQYCAKSNCKFAFIVGDVIYPGGVSSVADPQFKTKFEDPYQNINFPFYIAYGNHDYLGCTSCYIQYATMSAKWKMPTRYYAQNWQNIIEFFVIDTENFDKEQANWLINKLNNTSAKWRIVLGHRPIRTFEIEKHQENWMGKEQLKDILCHNADIYIAGHSHILEYVGEITDNCRTIQIISGGGGATPRKVLQANDDEFYFEDNGFISLSLHDHSLSFTFLNDKNETLYTKILPK